MNAPATRATRRQFFKAAAVTTTGYWVAGGVMAAESKSPSEKLNIAVIGCGGKGSGHVSQAAGQNLVALCDVDQRRAAKAFERHAKTPKFADYRQMLDKLDKQLDAVIVSTPDHHHAPASVRAMKMGKHVYCEKPLAHNVHECRVMAEVAKKMKVATQMGNQAHSNSAHRTLVEIIRSGAIGRIREAHAWCPKNFSATDWPNDKHPVPKGLEWDLWLGPARERPYHPNYVPFSWRGWRDYGTGGLGDMACHIMDPIFWSLDLEYPQTVEATADEPASARPAGFAKNLTVKYDFGSRGKELFHAPVTVYWHHGDHVPTKRKIAGVDIPSDVKLRSQGVLLIGEKGMIHGDRGPGLIAIWPRDKFADYKPPTPTLPRTRGHHQEWFAACKGGPAALSNFDYAARLTETVLLGNVAHMVGEKLEWDAKTGRAANNDAADRFLRREYRTGWSL